MKYNLIQTLGRYKGMELAPTEKPTGKYNVVVSEMRDEKTRMMFSKTNTDNDIVLGDWRFGRIVDIMRYNNSSATYFQIEGITPEGVEFSFNRAISIPSMQPCDVPLNVMHVITALNDIEKGFIVISAFNKNIPSNIENIKTEIEKLQSILPQVEAINENYYIDRSFKNWLYRNITYRIASLEDYLEKKLSVTKE